MKIKPNIFSNLIAVIPIHLMCISFVGERGYELHIASENCVPVYKKLADIGRKYGLKDAGFRAYNSLNCEAGLIHFDHVKSFT